MSNLEMQTIKFSHEYYKMPQFINEKTSSTIIIGVEKQRIEKIDSTFLHYDTVFNIRGGVEEYFPLPKKGDVLIIFLFSFNLGERHIWTTIRRWTPRKEAYYKDLIGQRVRIEIKGGVI